MQDVMREIMKIDQLAFESQKYSLETLEKKKEKNSNVLMRYEVNKLANAEKKGAQMYKRILEQAEQAVKLEEEKAKQIRLEVEYHYLQSENQLVEALFQELMQVEA